jgi:hypothetical protein
VVFKASLDCLGLKVLLEIQDKLEALEHLEQPERRDSLVRQVVQELQELQDLQDHPVVLDHKEHRVHLELQEMPEHLGH